MLSPKWGHREPIEPFFIYNPGISSVLRSFNEVECIEESATRLKKLVSLSLDTIDYIDHSRCPDLNL